MTTKSVRVGPFTYHTLLTLSSHPSIKTDPSTPPILLVHALMANHEMWTSTVTALTRAGYNTLQVDNIGHNKTSVPADIPSSVSAPAVHFDEMTRHFRDIVRDVTGQDRVEAVVGCSMGGVLALRYGLLFPTEILNGIVICDAPGASTPPFAVPLWSDRITQFSQDLASGTETLITTTVDRWIPGDDAQSERARLQARELVRTCTLDGYRVCADAIRSYDYAPLLGGMKVRTMVLAGREDASIGPPELTEGMARAVEGAEMCWMEDTGHLPPLQRPREFEGVLLGFLERGRGGR